MRRGKRGIEREIQGGDREENEGIGGEGSFILSKMVLKMYRAPDR